MFSGDLQALNAIICQLRGPGHQDGTVSMLGNGLAESRLVPTDLDVGSFLTPLFSLQVEPARD